MSAKNTTEEQGTDIVSRFQRGRWSATRRVIANMNPGDNLEFHDTEYFNAKQSGLRLGDAYQDRKWVVSRRGGKVTVQCLTNE